mmetsp:Transcript_11929/g.22864  ORF Transcript_11929/g.22864 Transcript_11929/m.22864 type:complete len:437 (+) Transcript_11929:36-1346(+)
MDSPYTQQANAEDKDASWRARYSFIWIFYANCLVGCTSYSLVLPSIWPYIQKSGGSDEFLALVMFAYSFGELVGSLSFGYLFEFIPTKYCMIACVSSGLIGSLAYTAADFFPGDAALWLIFIGRSLQGFWTGGQQSVEAAYISEVVEPNYKLVANSEIGICSVVGFLAGPLVGYFFTFLDIHLSDTIRIDQYTSPGYFVAIFTTIMIFVFAFKFDEIDRQYRYNLLQNSISDPLPPDTFGVRTCLFVATIVYCGFAVQETITTPFVTDVDHVYTDSFDWSLQGAYLLYISASVASIFAFVFLSKTSDLFDDRKILYYSLYLGLFGWLLFIDWVPRHINHGLFLVGYFMVALGYPIARCVVVNVLSHVVGPNPAGKYMGWVIATGGVARCIGPFISIYALKISPRVCFGTTSFLFLLSIASLHANWRRCARHPYSSS